MAKIKEKVTKFVNENKQELLMGLYGAICGLIMHRIGMKQGIKIGYAAGALEGYCAALFNVATKKGGSK